MTEYASSLAAMRFFGPQNRCTIRMEGEHNANIGTSAVFVD